MSTTMRIALGMLMLLLPSLCAAQSLYLTVVTHNEEPNVRQPDYLNKEFYLRNRELVRQLALTIRDKSAMLNFQSDWNFLMAVARYDVGEVVANTNGKNILKWMVEDLEFEADPHAHETKYNYADVAYLHTQLGVKPSGNVGGFLYDPPENPQGWEQHEKGISGRVYPSYFWRADNLWGAGTTLHRGNDERRHGVWKPKDKHNFYVHGPSRRLTYVGGNCYSWGGLPAQDFSGVRELLSSMIKGEVGPEGFYTANIFVGQGRLNEELIRKIASDLDSVDQFVKSGTLIWSSLTETAKRWHTAYGGKPFQKECEPKNPSTR